MKIIITIELQPQITFEEAKEIMSNIQDELFENNEEILKCKAEIED